MSSTDRYDRYFVKRGAAGHLRFRRLTVPERHAFFMGVLSIAAGASPRGRLLVGTLEASAEDVAHEANVSTAVARSALRKLEDGGMLIRDDQPGLCVHDWEDYQPEPKRRKPSDSPVATRLRKQASRARTDDGHADVTPRDIDGHAPEEKRREENNPPNPPQAGGAVIELPPKGGRKRDQDRWEASVAAAAQRLFPVADQRAAAECVRRAATLGKTSDTEITEFAGQWWPQLTGGAA